jgi:hypothetical protein
LNSANCENDTSARVEGPPRLIGCRESERNSTLAGEYQLAQKLIDHNQASQTGEDIISELEQHIRVIEDGGDSVITRGC